MLCLQTICSDKVEILLLTVTVERNPFNPSQLNGQDTKDLFIVSPTTKDNFNSFHSKKGCCKVVMKTNKLSHVNKDSFKSLLVHDIVKHPSTFLQVGFVLIIS